VEKKVYDKDASYVAWQTPSVIDNNQLKKKLLTTNDVSMLQKKKQEQLARVFEQAKKKGYQVGEQEGMVKGSQYIEDSARKLERLVATLDIELKEQNTKFEQQLTDLAITIAQAVVKKAISLDKEIIKGIVNDALSFVPLDSSNLQIKLNPADVDCIQGLINNNLITIKDSVVLTADESIDQGGCIISNQLSSVDATCAARLKIVLEQIGLESTTE